MNHQEQLQRMAERGTPIGAVALLERVDQNLPRRSPTPTAAHRRRGPLWGLAVFAVIVTAGLAIRWLVPIGWDVTGGDGIEWERAELPGPRLGPIRVANAGPGGYLVVPVLPSVGASLWFSEDARSWTPVEVPGMEFAGVVSVAATKDRWMILGDSNLARGTWTSTDGVTWTEAVFPDSIGDTVLQVVATSDWFLAVSNDVFDAGTTVWRSRDARSWEQVDRGPVSAGSGELAGTTGGFVWYSSGETSGIEIAVSVDGSEWIEGSLTTPDEIAAVAVSIRVVQDLGERWVVLAEVTRRAGVPVVAAFASTDGLMWSYQGIPPFGEVEGSAAGVGASSVVDNRLVAVGVVVPVSTRPDGTLIAGGQVRSQSEAWSTSDGSTWSRTLTTDAAIEALGGGAIDDRLVGFWVSEPDQSSAATGSDERSEPVVTTMMAVDPGEVDPAGAAFQDRILEDGVVTREEATGAMDAWKACMEDHGVTDVEYEIRPDGAVGKSFASPSPSGALEGAIDRVCDVGWSERVLEKLLQPD